MQKSGAGIIWGITFEVAPAAIFGAAAGFSAAALLGSPLLSTSPVSGGAAAFGFAWLLLRRLGGPRHKLHLPKFEVEAFEPEELILEDVVTKQDPPEQELILEDVFEPATAEEELVLENPLPAVGDDSRVIRLFDPAKMQTAGELQARIERHLRNAPQSGMPDATQELHEALAALRQSLR